MPYRQAVFAPEHRAALLRDGIRRLRAPSERAVLARADREAVHDVKLTPGSTAFVVRVLVLFTALYAAVRTEGGRESKAAAQRLAVLIFGTPGRGAQKLGWTWEDFEGAVREKSRPISRRREGRTRRYRPVEGSAGPAVAWRHRVRRDGVALN